ncbi:MAG TPA: Stp1/IreP family PP2C-type Ser/Thr phosphatase [Candidatus Desulfobacillus sp.]|nr:Stp1/IreP family PP2C-type Ser/Thr phosphatase [Candidatus Desulfobacillus sp.]
MDLGQHLRIASCTDAGRVRTHNEDAVYASAAAGLAILADGMGGYNAGEVASGMATALLGSELEKAFLKSPPHRLEVSGRLHAHKVLETEIARSNAAIYQAAQSQPQYAGMGTTLVVALFYDNRVTVAHIGDSRLYRLRGEDLQVLTRDHSLLQEQIDSGMITAEEARLSHNRNLVTRALGVDPVVEPEIRDYDTMPGDIYLLCSDGLNDMVEEEEIALTLQALAANLDLAATQLVEMANDCGGRDNVSVILVRILREYPAARGWWARLLQWLR